MSTLLRDGTITDDRRLDRLVQFDERSRAYPIREALSPAQQTLVTRRWHIPRSEDVLDQGSDGSCVGFGVTNELRATPVPVRGLDATFAHDTIYWGAQRIDQWPGGSYPGGAPSYEGTSVLAGMQTATDLGFYGEYRWAFSEPELALGVSHLGPAVIGINWYNDMFQPDPYGYLHVSGGIAGGHCILVIGICAHTGYYTLYNSWGPNWGHGGTAKLRRTDMARLLSENGDATIITERFDPTR